jgi:hypothetical protein
MQGSVMAAKSHVEASPDLEDSSELDPVDGVPLRRAFATISNRLDSFSCLTRLKIVNPFTPVFDKPVAFKKNSLSDSIPILKGT